MKHHQSSDTAGAGAAVVVPSSTSKRRKKKADTGISGANEETTVTAVDRKNGAAEVKKNGLLSGAVSSMSILRVSVIVIFTISSLIFISNFYTQMKYRDLESIARVGEFFRKKSFSVTCSKDYVDEASKFPGCVPKNCGRFVMDGLVTKEEIKRLANIAKKGLALGGSSGGASIMDLHSGALSKDDKFVDIYKLMKTKKNKPFNEDDLQLYKRIRSKIQFNIAEAFGIPHNKLYLTKPTFFSRMTTKSAKTIHDEYWHVHSDKETYGTFHYTSLLYLTDYDKDFTGGRFIFVDKSKNITIEPKKGRISFFTSGSENLHHVEKLESGTRYAITVAFTCDSSKAIADPVMR
ncbi:2-oxoglutarate and iron-dependent oxygenase domain-containing protein 3-like [Tubulanus polymorphus]|uniref:2-oxoglutarate and iron-dependent oxygenase domain-containing protein 3-like n=1 Tax=Tubulanus polymorphus TaxID=672921 RepID=UPI003DA3CA91